MITVSINKNYVRSDGKSAVYAFIHIQGKKLRYAMGISVEPKLWDTEKGMIIGASKEVKDYNMVIQNNVARMHDVFVKYRLLNRKLTPEIFRKEYERPSLFANFFDFWKIKMLAKKGLEATATIKSHQVVLNKLQEFKKEIEFEEINEPLLNEFAKYLKRIGNNVNTVQKNMAILKVYVNLAFREKQITDNPFKFYKIKRVQPERVYLETDELKKLWEVYRKNILPLNIQMVLRSFLFACYTGLRISDMKTISFEHVVNNMLVFQPVKTRFVAKTVTIPLINPANILINDAAKTKGTLFDTYADQVTNRYLKKAMDLCGIEKQISFHSARHTFATMFLRETKNLPALQKLLGHKDIKETMIYAHILTDDLVYEMKEFGKALNCA